MNSVGQHYSAPSEMAAHAQHQEDLRLKDIEIEDLKEELNKAPEMRYTQVEMEQMVRVMEYIDEHPDYDQHIEDTWADANDEKAVVEKEVEKLKAEVEKLKAECRKQFDEVGRCLALAGGFREKNKELSEENEKLKAEVQYHKETAEVGVGLANSIKEDCDKLRQKD